MPRLPLAFTALFLAYFAGILLREAARKTLSAEQKVALIDGLSPVRKYGFLPAILIIFLTYNRPLSWLVWSVSCFLVTLQLIRFWKIRRIVPPGRFVSSSAVELCVVILGIALFVLIALWRGNGVA